MLDAARDGDDGRVMEMTGVPTTTAMELAAATTPLASSEQDATVVLIHRQLKIDARRQDEASVQR